MVRALLACLTLAALPIVTIGPDETTAALIAQIEGAQPGTGDEAALTVAELMSKYHVPGVSVAVIKDFRIHWSKGYGRADVVSGARVDTDTLFQAASISKPVAAMAVLKAVQDGRFSLDDDINSIVRSWKLPTGDFTRERPVTPRSLLSHTSGLGDGFAFPGYHPSAPLPTLVQILDGQPPSNVGPVRMERPPLTAMKYSGGGVTLMQLAMTDVFARPFPALMQELVLGPIGMSNSRCRRHSTHMRRAPTIARAKPGMQSGTCTRNSKPPVYGRRPAIWRSSRSRCSWPPPGNRAACCRVRWCRRW